MVNFSEVKKLEHAKRAIEVALAGGHSMLITGGAGTGKTLLLNSVSEFSTKLGLIDDLQSFNNEYIAACAERLSRWDTDRTHIFTARPCECGYLNSLYITCDCTDEQKIAYQKRLKPVAQYAAISIDLGDPLSWQDFIEARPSEASEVMFNRLKLAQARQGEPNNVLTRSQLEKVAPLDPTGLTLLKTAYKSLVLNPGQALNIWRVAATIRDLRVTYPERSSKDAARNSEQVQGYDVAEAVQYRRKLGV